MIIVTTEEEYNLNYKGSGRDTVAMSKLLEKKYDNIICVHYPYTGGKMAHQVNYAVNFIRGSFQLKAGIILLFTMLIQDRIAGRFIGSGELCVVSEWEKILPKFFSNTEIILGTIRSFPAYLIF